VRDTVRALAGVYSIFLGANRRRQIAKEFLEAVDMPIEQSFEEGRQWASYARKALIYRVAGGVRNTPLRGPVWH
jgi:hypothetical protein